MPIYLADIRAKDSPVGLCVEVTAPDAETGAAILNEYFSNEHRPFVDDIDDNRISEIYFYVYPTVRAEDLHFFRDDA